MADVVDLVGENDFSTERLAHQRGMKQPEIQRGRCLYCDEVIVGEVAVKQKRYCNDEVQEETVLKQRLYCDDDCRLDFEHEQKVRDRQRRM